MKNTILKINASMRIADSSSRKLSQLIVSQLSNSETTVTERDLTHTLPFVDEQWISANFTPAEQRTQAQKETLALSEQLIGELEAADNIVIGVPIYNFGVPAAFKAWIDMVARARRTFKYTENGPVGLLENKKAYVVVTSGGTKLDSEVDFVSPWIKHVLGFLGIQDVEFIDASVLMSGEEQVLSYAKAQIEKLK